MLWRCDKCGKEFKTKREAVRHEKICSGIKPNFKLFRHPVTKDIEFVRIGFCWPALFFGFLWYLYKGMIARGFFWLIISIPTFGLGWIVAAFRAISLSNTPRPKKSSNSN